MIRFGTWSILLLLGSVQGIFVSAGLLAKPANRSANVFLSVLVFLASLKLVPYIIGYAGFYMVYPWLDLAPFDLSLGFGPLLYLYITRLTKSKTSVIWRLHLIPLAVQFLVYFCLFLQPMSFKNQFEDSIGPTFNTAENLAVCASFCGYLALTWKEERLYERALAERFANPDLYRLRPLRLMLSVITVTFLAFAGAKLWSIFVWRLTYYQMFPLYLLLSAVVYAFGFVAFQFVRVDLRVPAEVPEARETNWAALADLYTSELDNLKIWQDPLLSVMSAARALGTTEGRLSKAINLGLGVSFSTWINQVRIEQVARELGADPDATIFEVAQRCGFNSKASFNRWFRSVKGCTPTEFRLARTAASPAPELHPSQPQYPHG